MFKAVVIITLCVAVLARRDSKSHQPGSPGRPSPPHEGQMGSPNSPHLRVARQIPGMPGIPGIPGLPPTPGGFNPGEIPAMMTNMAKKGLGVASSMMDPNTWANGMSQMSKLLPQVAE